MVSPALACGIFTAYIEITWTLCINCAISIDIKYFLGMCSILIISNNETETNSTLLPSDGNMAALLSELV